MLLMRILLVSFRFAPYNSVGAVRVSKLARFFLERGHDIRVLTARDAIQPATLTSEVDESLVVRTGWFNVNFLPQLFFGGKKQITTTGYSTKVSFIKKLGNLYQSLFNFPDDAIGWYPYAVRSGKKLIDIWKPDLIYTSALPATDLLVARALSKSSGVPWVAELRDLWVDPSRYPYGSLRRRLETHLENKVLRAAHAIVVVSKPWAEYLRSRFSCPIQVVTNGFDRDDFVELEDLSPPLNDELRIVYPGVIYPNFQNIEPLLAALEQLGEEANSVRVVFYTRYMGAVMALAEKHGVAHLIVSKGRVSYQESLIAQVEADILLLLAWADPKFPEERGIIPGKLFEYIGARRPILTLGFGYDVASEIVRGVKAGFVSNDPNEIAEKLREWIRMKREKGQIPALPKDVQKGMSRQEQFEILNDFLQEHLFSS